MNILTFDIEEWFHILDNESTRSEEGWKNFESRIHRNMELIFRILDRTNCKATFFCLGWIAKEYPKIISEISNRGYEIGSHGSRHQLIYSLSEREFKEDVEYSICTLEDIIGKKVKYYRAPGFSIREDNKWALEILASQGIEIDCSIFPVRRAHGGFPSYNNPEPSIIEYNGIELKELPISYTTFLNIPIVFNGGGYFRLFPYAFLKHWTKKSDYIMSYFHPRDFDWKQPVIKDLGLIRRFKSYAGLKGTENKLIRWLEDFDFLDINTAEKMINWDIVNRVVLA